MRFGRLIPLVSYVLISTALSSYGRGQTSSAQPSDPRLQEEPTPRFSVDQYLNGEMPGRKPSPPTSDAYDSAGFAADRLYHVPAPGVHPRIFFAPEDLPRIRQQIANTKAGQAEIGQLRSKMLNVFEKVGWEKDCYGALKGGDVEKFRSIYTGPQSKVRSGPPGSQSNTIVQLLAEKALLSLLDDDKQSLKDAASASVTLVRYFLPGVIEAEKRPLSGDYWMAVREVVGDGSYIGQLYDFTASVMTPIQRAQYHDFLVKVLSNRYTHGMELPPHWRNWNHIGMTLDFQEIALSIEGEPGYDRRIFDRGVDVARDYINYSVAENGVGKEAIGYHTGGMDHTSLFLIAAANRGVNLFTNVKYRRMTDSWLIWSMQPFGYSWASGGDLGTFPPNTGFVQTVKFFYPSDRKVDFVYQNLPDNNPIARKSPELLSLLTSVDPSKTSSVATGGTGRIDYKYGADFHLGNSLYDSDHGILFLRDGWNRDATSLQLVARGDTTFASHDFPDRGTFYFSADGKPWTLPGFRETESKFLNTITIDGIGQGYFATPAKWIGVKDTDLASFAALDLKYCYDWRWIKPVLAYSDADFKRDGYLDDYREAAERFQKHNPGVRWERDPLESTIDYYSGYLAGDPRMWAEDSWVLRGAYNPVLKAFRTVGLVRGSHSYALVVDDIQKDESAHLYEWRAYMPTNVEAVHIDSNSILLSQGVEKHVSGAPVGAAYRNLGLPDVEDGDALLYVRVLDVNQPDQLTEAPTMSLQALELIKTDDMHQFYGRDTGMVKALVLPSRSIAPDYKVMLYPLRKGEPLPEVHWSEAHDVLEIQHDGVTDRFRFSKDSQGRTHIVLARGQEQYQMP